MSEKSISVLPEGFLWGGATSASQYEGGCFEGGRRLSHMDYIRRIPKSDTDYNCFPINVNISMPVSASVDEIIISPTHKS